MSAIRDPPPWPMFQLSKRRVTLATYYALLQIHVDWISMRRLGICRPALAKQCHDADERRATTAAAAVVLHRRGVVSRRATAAARRHAGARQNSIHATPAWPAPREQDPEAPPAQRVSILSWGSHAPASSPT